MKKKEGCYMMNISHPKKKRMRSLLSWPTAGKLVFLKVGYWKKNCRLLACNSVWWKPLNEYFVHVFSVCGKALLSVLSFLCFLPLLLSLTNCSDFPKVTWDWPLLTSILKSWWPPEFILIRRSYRPYDETCYFVCWCGL